MADFIGTIEVPDPGLSGLTFPIVTEFGFSTQISAPRCEHQFISANAKITQRFELGIGKRRHLVIRQTNPLTPDEYDDLLAFWEDVSGPYQPFNYSAPNDDGKTFTTIKCVFEAQPVSFEHLLGTLTTTGLYLIQLPLDEDAPSYPVRNTSVRFPSSELGTALSYQVQTLIPQLKITALEPGYPVLYLSDRRVTIGGDLYLPRIISWGNGSSSQISQGINGESDDATFVLGNADRVLRDVSFSTDLRNARVDFSLFHVQTQNVIHIWTGRIATYDYDEGPNFTIRASDFLRELSMAYPPRVISQQCYKYFNDDLTCPYAGNGTPGFTVCGRSWANCQERGMTPWFGGIKLDPQRIFIKDNTTGSVGKIGRRILSPLSVINEGAAGNTLQQVYTDVEMPVNCVIVSAREEGEYFDAIGIVSEGPIHSFAQDGLKHRLDGQAPHGPLPLGLRRSHGHDPAANNDPDGDSDQFSLGQVDPNNPDASIYPNATKAGGVAFLEIRRVDEPGLQLSKIEEHQMTAWIAGGMSGFVWTSPGDRAVDALLTNPIWIFINMILRATGLHMATMEEQETIFDVNAAVAAANICNNIVNRSDAVPGLEGTEKQFTFRGIVGELRTLKDWLNNVLMGCLGGFVQSMGKIKPYIRVNSSSVSAYTTGNTIIDTVKITGRAPEYNSVTVNFASADFDWQPDSYTIDDHSHQRKIGTIYPQKLPNVMNLPGCSTKAMAGRVAITRLREELGGVTPEEWRKACYVSLKTTVLGLDTEVGDVVSLTHPDAPGGRVEFRVHRYTLFGDYSILLEGPSTVDSMYDLVIGPKPDDVIPSPVPVERHWDTLPPQPWFPNTEQPDADDPLYSETDWNFGLEQVYEIGADGTALAKLVISGQYPVIKTLGTEGPRIGTYGISSSGGSIPSRAYVTIALTAIDSTGNETISSQPVAIPVDAGTGTNKITLSEITWPTEPDIVTTGYRLYASYDHNQMSLQAEDFGSQPTELELLAVPNLRTRGLPRPDMDVLMVRGKVAEHSGVVGVDITSTVPGGLTVVDVGWTDDEWIGRIVSVITDRSDGSGKIWNFTITSNNLDTLWVTPDPQTLGVEALDTLIIRTLATTYSETTIGDSKFQNSLYPSGANPGEEVGRVVRIIAGTGAGQERRISGNDATVLTVDSPWLTTPDATSIFVVERPAWEFVSEVGRLGSEIVDGVLVASLPIDNFLDRTLLVEVVPVTKAKREPQRKYNISREIYIYGGIGDFGLMDDGSVWRDGGPVVY